MSSTTQDSSIAAQLRDDILRGQYRQGERLPSERDLADRFGVHRSTVREAFKRLAQLGIADIRPGGTRVGSIEEASLDVLEHLLALEDPPDPNLVDETLETMSGFLALAARLGTERADDAERASMLGLLDEMLEGKADDEAPHEVFRRLGEAFVAASGNRVLRLVRHGLKTRYSNYVMPGSRAVPYVPIEPHLRRLRESVEARAGAEASEAIFALTKEIRGVLRAELEAERRSAEPSAVRAGGAR